MNIANRADCFTSNAGRPNEKIGPGRVEGRTCSEEKVFALNLKAIFFW